jgi:hypothetical protein
VCAVLSAAAFYVDCTTPSGIRYTPGWQSELDTWGVVVLVALGIGLGIFSCWAYACHNDVAKYRYLLPALPTAFALCVVILSLATGAGRVLQELGLIDPWAERTDLGTAAVWFCVPLLTIGALLIGCWRYRYIRLMPAVLWFCCGRLFWIMACGLARRARLGAIRRCMRWNEGRWLGRVEQIRTGNSAGAGSQR